MTVKKMLLLAAILAGMALYITKIELANDDIKHALEQPLENLVPQSVSEISIAGEKGSFQLVNPAPKADATPAPDASITEEEARQWKVQGINDSGLERGVLNTLLSNLRGLKMENGLSTEDTEKDLGVYGLSSPALTVGVKAGGVEKSFQFGKLNEYVNKRYVKEAAGSTVYLSTNELFTAASKSAADFRDHGPIAVNSDSVTKLSVNAPTGSFVLEQSGGNWRITSPGAYTASNYLAANFVRELGNTKVTAFIDDAAGKEAEYGLSKPALSISAEVAGSDKPVTAEFGTVTTEADGKKSSRYYLKVSGKNPVYEVASDPALKFGKPVKELREKQLFRFASDRITQIKIAVAGREDVVLVKGGEGRWTVNGKEADAPFVSEFLSSLTEITASDFPTDTADLGFATPAATITCTLTAEAGKEGTEEKALIFGKELALPPGRVAVVGGTEEPFIVTQDSFRKVTPKAEALLKSESAPEETPAAVEPPVAKQ